MNKNKWLGILGLMLMTLGLLSFVWFHDFKFMITLVIIGLAIGFIGYLIDVAEGTA